MSVRLPRIILVTAGFLSLFIVGLGIVGTQLLFEQEAVPTIAVMPSDTPVQNTSTLAPSFTSAFIGMAEQQAKSLIGTQDNPAALSIASIDANGSYVMATPKASTNTPVYSEKPQPNTTSSNVKVISNDGTKPLSIPALPGVGNANVAPNVVQPVVQNSPKQRFDKNSQQIINQDDRVNIDNTLASPWSAVVSLTLNSGQPSQSYCSGALIAQNYVLTAAHCLYWQNVKVSTITVIPARNGSVEPFGRQVINYAEGNTVFIPHQWSENNGTYAFGYDFAIIKLSSSIAVTPFNIGYFSDSYLTGSISPSNPLKASGYPVDRGTQCGFNGSQYCPDLLFSADTTSTTLNARTQNDMLFGADTSKGESGGPIWFISPVDNTSKQIVGIISGDAVGFSNYAIRISPEVLDTFQAWGIPYTSTTNCIKVDLNVLGNGLISATLANSPGCGRAEYTDGTNITLTAKPLSSATFSNWIGNGGGASIVIAVNSPMSLTAVFSQSDVNPPTASWNNPTNGSTVAARVLPLAVNAADDVGVREVRFRAKWNGQWYGVGATSITPYTLNWNWCTTNVPDGDIELDFEALDTSNNSFIYSGSNTDIHVTKNYSCPAANPLAYDRLAAIHWAANNNYNDNVARGNSSGRYAAAYVGHTLQKGGLNTSGSWYSISQIIQWMQSNSSAWEFQAADQLTPGDYVLYSDDPNAINNWNYIDAQGAWSRWDHVAVVTNTGLVSAWDAERKDIPQDVFPTYPFRQGVHIRTATTDLYSRVEAENYSSMSGIVVKPTVDSDGALDIEQIDNGDTLIFNHMNFGTGPGSIQVRVAGFTGNGAIEFRAGDANAAPFAIANVAATGGNYGWTTISAPTTFRPTGTQPLYLKFTGGNSSMFLNWFMFSQGNAVTYEDQGPLAYGQTQSRTLSSTEQRWSLDLTTAAAPLLVQTQMMGNLKYRLQLKDAKGNLIAETQSALYGDAVLSIETTLNGTYYLHLVPTSGSGQYHITAYANTLPHLEFATGLHSAYGNVTHWTAYLDSAKTFNIHAVRDEGNLEWSYQLKTRGGALLDSGVSLAGQVVSNATAGPGWVDFYLTPNTSTSGSYSVTLVSGTGAATATPTFTPSPTPTTAPTSTPSSGTLVVNESYTLVQAINDANTTPGANRIVFNYATSGVHVISAALPAITDPVVIDGTTQPGYSGTPLIQVQGIGISAGNSTIRGLITGQINLSTNGNNVIEGCYIGTDSTGHAIPPHSGYVRGNGVVISNTSNGNRIGGPTLGAGNVIDNNYFGIDISSNDNVIQGNIIGLDPSGAAYADPNHYYSVEGYGNGNYGVYIHQGSNNLIGGNTPSARNIISSNGSVGIYLSGNNVSNNLIKGNYIGTDITGEKKFPNSSIGVLVDKSDGTVIGGSGTGDGNVIAGNAGSQIQLSLNGGVASNVTVQGNIIGASASVTKALGGSYGFDISSSAQNVTIGGSNPNEGNIIAGVNEGIYLDQPSGITIEGNTIFSTSTGIYSNTDSVLVAGNTIANNSFTGVTVAYPRINNTIVGNNIYGSHFGIFLDANNGQQLTPNDPDDTDFGTNNLQNYPVINSASKTNTTVTINASLNSNPNQTYYVEFFSSGACNATGYGDGEFYLGYTNVTTDGSGNVTFSATFPIQPGNVITSTATDGDGNTSEFSKCVNANMPILQRPSATATRLLGEPPTVTPSKTPTATGTMFISATPTLNTCGLQSMGTLSWDTPVTNNNVTCNQQRWSVVADGNPAYIEVQPISGNLRYKLELGDSSQTLQASWLSSSTGHGIMARSADTGSYTLDIIPLSGTGTYDITLHHGYPVLQLDSQQAAYSDVTEWQFTFASTQSYYIQIKRLDGNLDYTVNLTQADNTPIDSTMSLNGNSYLGATSAAGTYHVTLTGLNGTSGSYSIGLISGTPPVAPTSFTPVATSTLVPSYTFTPGQGRTTNMPTSTGTGLFSAPPTSTQIIPNKQSGGSSGSTATSTPTITLTPTILSTNTLMPTLPPTSTPTSTATSTMIPTQEGTPTP